MKKIYIYILLLVLPLLFAACDSLLDLKPEDSVSKEVFFENRNDFDQGIIGLYSMLRPTNEDASNGAYAGNLYWEVCGDQVFWKNSWTYPWFDISRGQLKAVTSGVASIYGNLYQTVYWANSIIVAINGKESSFDEDFVNHVKGQAHFVRAICYLRLTSLWGAVPLVDRIYTPSESKLPRTPVEEITAKLIIPDLDIAIQSLDEKPYSKRLGMATKQAAMGMKVRAYLYNKEYDKTVTAVEELMNLAASSGNIDFLDDYASVFANDNEDNAEILFCLKYMAGGSKQGSTFNTTFGSKLPGLPPESMNGSWATVAIVPEFIDSYPLTDGKTVAEGSSAYDPDLPWANRGPRFESTYYIGDYSVLSNGLLYEKVYVCNISTQCGEDYPLTLNKGYMNEDNKIDWLREDESDFIILRYTDVLMMYAEAKTMLNQIDNSVYEILDMVRDRAGIARVKRGQSQAEMMKTIQNERAWEFAFEGLRYFDIRRWGIAEEVINAVASDEKYDFGSHKLFVAPANYLWPIPQSAIDVNPNLLPNNPGY